MDGDIEARYAHLLNPIRDLAKNWDVDIASCLEEYTTELEKVKISFDGGATSMNFAEAALLIQGSAAVYSKKVEFLYALVYEVLDTFAKKKKQPKQKASVDQQGNDADVPEEDDDDEEWKWISLDDLDVGKNIDLVEDESGNAYVPVMPRIPISLLKYDDLEKGDTPLLSIKGEVLGNRMDFKMNTSVITDIGAMLLDLSHLSILEASLKAQGKICGDLLADKGSDPYRPPESVETQTDAEMAPPPDNFGEDEDDGGVFDLPDDPASDQTNMAAEETRSNQRQLRRRLPSKPKPKEDIWEPLDPHEDTKDAKPLRRAKTWKLPESLTTEAKRKRKRGRESVDKKPIEPLYKFINMMIYPNGYKPPKELDFQEFDFHYWPEHQRRQEALKQERIKLEKLGYTQEIAEQDLEAANDVSDDDNDAPPPADFDPVEDDDLPVDNQELRSAMAEASAVPYQQQIEREFLSSYSEVGDDPPPGSYEELVKRHVEMYLLQAQQSTKLTEQAQRLTEWEDRIIPRLEEEEKHPAFDIHKYGSDVIASFSPDIKGGSDSPVLLFKEIVKGKPAFEVARYFAATLQLANNYNVEIGYTGETPDMVDSMTVKLLSRTRHYEELVEYAAPSLQK